VTKARRKAFPLTKTLDPEDYEELRHELVVVDHFKLHDQHPHRRWEYAMALRAISTWHVQSPIKVPRHVDVGGGGSPFHLITDEVGLRSAVVDPKVNVSIQEFTARVPIHILTVISVLEHVPDADLDDVLNALSRILTLGGLLFFTVDYWNCEGPDVAHFHWMRERIYHAGSLKFLISKLRMHGFKQFGESERVSR
jgi:hypothetical protein